MRLALTEIINATGGVLIGGAPPDKNVTIRGVSIDSRGSVKDKLFVPVCGDNFNGHDFIEDAIKRGAVCSLTEKDIDGSFPIVKVKSARQALIDLAVYSRESFSGPVVAITGSAGKTTTKDMIASVLSQKYLTLKTKGNFNNDIGLPLTLLSRDSDHTAMVLEMGMNHRGEIRLLSSIGKPDICLITNIGDAHIENLGSREGILEAKCEIFEGMKKGGTVILNGDDILLSALPEIPHAGKTIYCRMTDAADIKNNGLKGTVCKISGTPVEIPLPGEHMIMNAIMAFTVGVELGLSGREIADGIRTFTPSGNRMAISQIDSGITLINDTYNASPPSMKAAIDMLANADGRKVCILGDMLELGKYAEDMHKDVGRYASQKADLIISVGTLSKHMAANRHFDTKEALIDEIGSLLLPGDTVLIKASRGMALETVADALKQGDEL